VPVIWTPSGSAFQYFETSVPIDPSLTSFVIVVSTTSSGAPLIDDVSFYPVGSDLTSSTYTLPYGQNSVTANGNVTKYTVLDGLGRQKYVLDTYGNIREKNTYQYQNMSGSTFSGGFSYPAQPNNDTDPAGAVLYGDNLFTATNCIDGATYTWTVTYSGTGSPTTTPGQITSYTQRQVLTFPAPSASAYYTANVKLTVTHPLYTTSTVTNSIPVEYPPLVANACAAGASNMMICGTTVTMIDPPYTCSGVVAPADQTGTTFAISGVNLATGETISGYQWMQSVRGAGVWKNKVTTSQYQVTSVVAAGNPGYDVQCQITTNFGRTVTSNIISVAVSCN
jgi:hypothetical protein